MEKKAQRTRFEFLILKTYPKERQFIIKKQIGDSLFGNLFGFLKRK